MVQLTRALMSSSTFCFAAKSAYYANDIHFVVDSQETAPPIPGGGPISFTPHGTQSLPQSSTHTCRIDKIGNTDNDAPEYAFFEILSRNMLILDFEVVEYSFVIILCG